MQICEPFGMNLSVHLLNLDYWSFWEVMESHGVVTAQNCTDPVYSKGGPPCKGQDYASWWKYKCIKGIFFKLNT